MKERTFIEQGMKKLELEKYLKKQLEKAGFTHLEIVKTPLVTRIVLNVARPGLAIGKGGQTISQLTREIEGRFGIENPQIEIQEIRMPELDATATVDRMSGLIERGFSWKSVAFRTVRDIQRAGAQGVELILSGKLSGKGGRKRKQRVASGYMKKVGAQTELVDFAKASAYPKAGAIGIKLRIIRPGVIFPDKVSFAGLKKEEEAPAAAEAEAAKAEETVEAAPEGIAVELAPAEVAVEKPKEKKEGTKEKKKAAKKAAKKPREKKAAKKETGKKKEEK